jgi:hypothetical protein
VKIIFLDQLGCYVSVAAASYLAGKIYRNAKAAEVACLPFFAAHRDLKVGRFYYIGQDPKGNELYTLGAGGQARLIILSARDLIKILENKDIIVLVDVSQERSLFFKVVALLKLFWPLEKAAVYLAALALVRLMPGLAAKMDLKMNWEPLDAHSMIKDN